jgi:hypothetical protein
MRWYVLPVAGRTKHPLSCPNSHARGCSTDPPHWRVALATPPCLALLSKACFVLLSKDCFVLLSKASVLPRMSPKLGDVNPTEQWENE